MQERAACPHFRSYRSRRWHPCCDLSRPASPSTGESNGSASLAEVGRHLFQRNCAFCHGRDAAGGETGPDLTRSKLVLADVNGNQISDVIRNGRPAKKMPAFVYPMRRCAALPCLFIIRRALLVLEVGAGLMSAICRREMLRRARSISMEPVDVQSAIHRQVILLVSLYASRA